jgi:replicative DNA helicase
MNSNEVLDKKEDILKKYSEMKLGRLFIKEYPTSTCTVHMIRNHVEKLSLKGFIPDIILIDYADIMRSSRQFDSLRHELKLIYEELRGLATELQIPIWTASQANRDSSNSEIVGLESMSEAYGKAMVADVILTISRRSHEKASGQGRLFVAKNRAGKDGLVYPVLIDTSRSLFKVTGDNITMSVAEEEDQNTMKQALRNKWQELQKEDIVTAKKN